MKDFERNIGLGKFCPIGHYASSPGWSSVLWRLVRTPPDISTYPQREDNNADISIDELKIPQKVVRRLRSGKVRNVEDQSNVERQVDGEADGRREILVRLIIERNMAIIMCILPEDSSGSLWALRNEGRILLSIKHSR